MTRKKREKWGGLSTPKSEFAVVVYIYYSNSYRYVRLFLAEGLGTFALVLFGDGAVAQVVECLNLWSTQF